MNIKETSVICGEPGHRGTRLEIAPKQAAGRFVTVSRVAYGTPVHHPKANNITFGHLYSETNFAGVSVGDELCTGRRLRTVSNIPTLLMSTPIHKINLLLDIGGMQVWQVTTRSGSVYELHVIK